MKIEIREVSLNDAAQIADIYNHYVLDTDVSFETERVTAAQMLGRIADIAVECPYFVAEREGAVVGYCYAHPWKVRAAYGHTFETTVYLRADECGHGTGRRLMEHLIAECRARGYHALIACITHPNTASERLHASLGFRQVSHVREVGRKFDRWLDIADYELLLQ